MSLVIAGGKSVHDYDGRDLFTLALSMFTFGVNDSAFIWPCDIVVALDPDWITARIPELKKLGRPIVTRKWVCLQDKGLDLIEVPNGIADRLSGMVAARISDALSRNSGVKSYVLGIDHTKGHYYNEESDCSQVVEKEYYESMCLTNTINLGMVSSKVACWPKLSKLPKLSKVAVTRGYREIATAWVRGEAAKIVKENI